MNAPMDKNNDRAVNSPAVAAGLAMAALLWLMHLLPFLLPEARLWGFNHLRFLPPFYLYLYLVAGAVSLAALFPPLRSPLGKIYNAVATALFEKRLRTRWLIMAAASLIIFWLGRLPIFLLGDSFSIVANISNDLPVIFKWSEIGAIYLAYFISRLLPLTGGQLGQYAYGIIAVVSGAATIYFFCAIAYELGKDAAGRLFVFCLSIFAGWMILFLGYTENYPVLWPFITGYIYFSLRYLNKKGGLLPPILMVVLALILHLQTLFFLISFPVLMVARGKTAHLYKKYRILIWIAACVVAVAAVIVFVKEYQSSLELRLYFIPLLTGHPTTPGYFLFSLPHLLDMANQFLLLTPLLPALIILGWRGWRPLFKNKVDLFLLLLSFGGFVFLLIIDPKLGMGRDWDLFALVGLAPMLLFAKNTTDSKKLRPAMLTGLALLALVMAFPYAAVSLSRQPALDNYKYLLHLDLPKSRTGITILRSIATADNDSLLLDSLKNVLIATYPSVHLAPEALNLTEQGRQREAMILVDSMAMYEPNSVEVLNLRGLVNMRLGNYAMAVKDLEMSARLGRYDARPLASLAAIYNRLGQPEKMMDALRKGQRRDPKLPEILDGLLTLFYNTGQYDSAVVYAVEINKMDSTNASPYWVLGNTALRRGDKARAKAYLTRFCEYTENPAMKEKAEAVLQQLK
jgi:Flp pilus assembly protein TadD